MKHTHLFALALCLALVPTAITVAEENPSDGFNMEKRLNELGFCAPTGDLTEAQMRAAIADFQTANGMETTGVADELTISIMRDEAAVSKSEYIAALAEDAGAASVLASGSYGDAVLRLQQALCDLGYFNEICDGSYGETTEFAVSRFQLANGLPETGIADQAVQIRLYDGTPVAWADFLSENTAFAGEVSDTVRMLQLWLKHMGYFSGECTGHYGDRTQQAVKRYQNDCGLEPTGNVDLDTAQLLFADAAKALSVGATMHRGDEGKRALEMCEKLRALGYRAHETFDMQTELALMQFQRANDLPATGAADSATISALRLQSQDGAPVPSTSADAEIDSDACARVLKQAMSLLGQPAEFDESYDFVRYVYLKCGVALPEKENARPVPQPEGAPLTAGCAVLAEADEGAFWGIVTADGALILNGEGYVVMRYLNALHIRTLSLPDILQ